MDIETLLKQPNALPSAPKVVQDLIKSFNDESVTSDEIARKLTADPVLSAKLLRLANSSYYHVSRSVNSVNDAVFILGFAAVRTLVISSGYIAAFKAAPGLDLKQFWAYCLNTAVIAKWLAKQLGKNTDLAFTIGMTHAIGQLIIHAGIPEKALQLDKEVNPLESRRFDLEKLTLGFNYAMVSAELATRWKFPEEFSHAIQDFPKPLEVKPVNEMACIIHLASWFARANALNFNAQEIRSLYPTEVEAKLGLEAFSMLEKMPSISELTIGLEELLS